MPKWILIVSLASALVFIIALLAIAIFIPRPTTFQIFVFRIVLALSAAAFGATIPGLFKIRLPLPTKGVIHAGGALGLFTLLFLINPPKLITNDQIPSPIFVQKVSTHQFDNSIPTIENIYENKNITSISVNELQERLRNIPLPKKLRNGELISLQFFSKKWGFKIPFQVLKDMQCGTLSRIFVEELQLQEYVYLEELGEIKVCWKIQGEKNTPCEAEESLDECGIEDGDKFFLRGEIEEKTGSWLIHR